MKNKFEVGDVVRTEGTTGHRVGTVEYRDDDPEQVYIYHVRYDNEGCESKEFTMKWHKPEELTLVSGSFDEDELARENTSSEQSIEHQALDYLLNQCSVSVKEELAKEVIEWAKHHLEELDFKEVRKAVDIAEQLVDEQSTEE